MLVFTILIIPLYRGLGIATQYPEDVGLRLKSLPQEYAIGLGLLGGELLPNSYHKILKRTLSVTVNPGDGLV